MLNEPTKSLRSLGKQHRGSTLSPRRIAAAREWRIFLPLLIMWIAFAAAIPSFLTTRNIANLLFESAVVGVMALGTTVVLITGEIDLSLGAVEGLSGILAALSMTRLGGGWFVGVVVALATGMTVGLLNGLFTVRLRIPSFIVTLAMLGVATGIASIAANGQTIYDFPHAYQQIGQGAVGRFTYPIFISIGVAIALHLILRHTRVGLMFYGVGSNSRAAELIGIPGGRVKVLAFVVSGLGAAIAGVMVSAELNAANPNLGTENLLDAIAAVVIGGTALTGGEGSILGTAIGVLIIGTITNGLNLENVDPFWQQFVVGLAILCVVGISVIGRNGVGRDAWRRAVRARAAEDGAPVSDQQPAR